MHLEALRRAVEADPHNVEARNALIEVALQRGEYAEAIHQHLDCAEIYKMRGQREQSLAHYEAILRLEAAVRPLVAQVKPEVYFQMGEYHREGGDFDTALEFLRKSRELHPGWWETHLALGRCYLARESLKEAIGEFQEVLRLSPEESALAYELLGEVFVRQGRPLAQVMLWFHHAVEHYQRRERVEDARRVVRRILELDPDDEVGLKFGVGH